MKNELRNCLEQIPESLTAFIDRYDLLILADEFIEIATYYKLDESYLHYYTFECYDIIVMINKIFDIKFLPKYGKLYNDLCKIEMKHKSYIISIINPKYCINYDELCKISIENNSYNIGFIDPKYCTIYNELCNISIKIDSNNIKYINSKYCTIYDELKKRIS